MGARRSPFPIRGKKQGLWLRRPCAEGQILNKDVAALLCFWTLQVENGQERALSSGGQSWGESQTALHSGSISSSHHWVAERWAAPLPSQVSSWLALLFLQQAVVRRAPFWGVIVAGQCGQGLFCSVLGSFICQGQTMLSATALVTGQSLDFKLSDEELWYRVYRPEAVLRIELSCCYTSA